MAVRRISVARFTQELYPFWFSRDSTFLLNLTVNCHNIKSIQCAYNVTLRRFCVTMFAVQKQYYIFWVCVCSLKYPACKTHCIFKWPVCMYHFPPTLSHKGPIFRKKKFIEHKMWFDFLYSFVWDTSHFKQNLLRFYRKCTHVYTLNSRYSCHILIKLEFCREIFEKSSYQVS